MRKMISSKVVLSGMVVITLLSGCSWIHWRSDSSAPKDGGNIDSPGADVTFANEQRRAKAAEAAKAEAAGGAQRTPATDANGVVTVTGTGTGATPSGTDNSNAGGAAADKAMDKSAGGNGADKGAMPDKAMGGDAAMKSGSDGSRGAMQKVTLQGDAVFGFGKSDEKGMQPGGRQKLDELADRILAMDKASVGGVTVVGHADRLGSPSGNMAISEKRAATVMNYLVKRGVDAGMLKSMGKGDAEPVVECPGSKATKVLIACLAANRRVEVLIGK
ncbi:MAG: OmpA family protein [Burkholderiales bacterium]